MSRRSEDDHGPDINGNCGRCGTKLGRGLSVFPLDAEEIVVQDGHPVYVHTRCLTVAEIDERLAVWQRLRAEASQTGAR